MSRSQVIERERRWRRLAIAGAALPLGLFIAGQLIRASVEIPSDALASEILRAVDSDSTAWIAGSVLMGLGVALMAAPLTYLFRAASARSERVMAALIPLCVIGPLLYGAQLVLFSLAQVDAADQFATQSQGVGDVYSLAADLIEDSGFLTAAQAAGIGILAFIFAMIYTLLWTTRVGLTTRFHGTLGMALGASLLFLGPVAISVLLVWFAYLALMLSGRLRRGRPPAWEVGEAVPWPGPGQEPVAAAAGGGDVVEGDASEIPGVDENPNAARRERAKRRKRKRRR